MTVTWNPADKAAGITLSNSNLTATGSSGNNSVRGTTSFSAGKKYLEFNTISFGGAGAGEVGFANSSFSLTSNSSSGSVAIFQYGGITPSGSMGSAPDGHTVRAAIDFDNGKVWFAYDAGNWNNDASANPATNTNGIAFSGLGALFPLIFLQNGGNATINATSGFTYSIPSGFAAWGGSTTVTGTMASTEAADTFSSAGNVPPPSGTKTTWNPTDKSTNVALSNTNHTATSTTGAGNEGVRANTSHTAGKWYIEFANIADGGHSYGVGLDSSTATLGNDPAFRVMGGGYVGVPGGGTYLTGLGDPAGHNVSMAIDLNAKKAWIRYDGGSWYGASGSGGDPVAGTNYFDLTGLATNAFPILRLQFSGDTTDINGGDTALAYSAPSGYTAWGFTPSPWASTETADHFSAVGYPGASGTRGDLTATESADTASLTGYTSASGVLSSSEATDVFSAFVTQPIRGTWASSEAKDRFAATGLGRGEDGIFVSTEATDHFAAVGNTPVSGRWTSSENPDQFSAFSSGVTATTKRRIFFTT